jgi:uncharacterized protein
VTRTTKPLPVEALEWQRTEAAEACASATCLKGPNQVPPRFDELPEAVQRELSSVLRIIFHEFERVLAGATQGWKRAGRILKVVVSSRHLAGRARTESVPHPVVNLLVVVSDKRLASPQNYWRAAESRLELERRIGSAISADVSFLVYSLDEVNAQLANGSTFFDGLIRTGIVLHDEGVAFTDFRRRTDAQSRAASIAHFNFWYPRSVNARRMANYSLEHGMLADAAFLLHQATERAYHCALLVLTLHSPKTHRLDLLRASGERVAPLLGRAWPRETKIERRSFSRLRRAYSAGRYDPAYRVTADEVRWLDERVAQLQELVRIEKAVQILPRLTREVFVARRLHGTEPEAIAEQTGLATRDVERRIDQALDAIVKDLKRSEWRPQDIDPL